MILRIRISSVDLSIRTHNQN